MAVQGIAPRPAVANDPNNARIDEEPVRKQWQGVDVLATKDRREVPSSPTLNRANSSARPYRI
jgi:hypothetical protein